MDQKGPGTVVMDSFEGKIKITSAVSKREKVPLAATGSASSLMTHGLVEELLFVPRCANHSIDCDRNCWWRYYRQNVCNGSKVTLKVA